MKLDIDLTTLTRREREIFCRDALINVRHNYKPTSSVGEIGVSISYITIEEIIDFCERYATDYVGYDWSFIFFKSQEDQGLFFLLR